MSTLKTEPPRTEASRDALAKLRIQRDTPRRQSRFGRWLKKLLLFVILLTVLLGVGWGAMRAGLLPSAQTWMELPELMQERPKVRLATLSVQSGRSAEALVVATGYLESRRQAKIGSRAAGRIQSVHVEEGDHVKAGQELAVLEHADLDASLAAAKATVWRAEAELSEQEVLIQRNKRDLDRSERLRSSNSISDADFDIAMFQYSAAVARRDSLKASIELAQARVSEANQMKENMFIRAPFDGTVISKDAEVGESILPGGMGEASGRGSAVTIADLEHLEVDCDVKEDFISRVNEDQLAEVVVDAVPDRRYSGRVRKIIPMGDRARATIKVKVQILDADKRLFPDMSSSVYFLPPAEENARQVDESERRVFCSQNAIWERDGSSFVWRVDEEDRLRAVSVQVGDERDERVEILSGLEGVERVIVVGRDLSEGQKVSVSDR
jgi:RND family efflux transporter MFP subunit